MKDVYFKNCPILLLNDMSADIVLDNPIVKISTDNNSKYTTVMPIEKMQDLQLVFWAISFGFQMFDSSKAVLVFKERFSKKALTAFEYVMQKESDNSFGGAFISDLKTSCLYETASNFEFNDFMLSRNAWLGIKNIKEANSINDILQRSKLNFFSISLE